MRGALEAAQMPQMPTKALSLPSAFRNIRSHAYGHYDTLHRASNIFNMSEGTQNLFS